MLKSQAVRRQAAQWATTLRSSAPDAVPFGYRSGDISTSDATKPESKNEAVALRRLNLCCNQLGDEGVDVLMESLREEIGLRALDLQYNRISDAGGRIVEQILHMNRELCIVDLRNNALDDIHWRVIQHFLSVNAELAKTNHRRPASGEENDPFTTWLDPKTPLSDTFLFMSSAFKTRNRHHQHTESSVKKRTFPKTASNARPRTAPRDPVPLKRPAFKVGPAPVRPEIVGLVTNAGPVVKRKKHATPPRKCAKTKKHPSERDLPRAGTSKRAAVLPRVEWVHDEHPSHTPTAANAPRGPLYTMDLGDRFAFEGRTSVPLPLDETHVVPTHQKLARPEPVVLHPADYRTADMEPRVITTRSDRPDPLVLKQADFRTAHMGTRSSSFAFSAFHGLSNNNNDPLSQSSLDDIPITMRPNASATPPHVHDGPAPVRETALPITPGTSVIGERSGGKESQMVAAAAKSASDVGDDEAFVPIRGVPTDVIQVTETSPTNQAPVATTASTGTIVAFCVVAVSNIDCAPRPDPSVPHHAKAETQMEHLIRLMESSLTNFHALLDRIESDDRRRKSKRRGKRREKDGGGSPDDEGKNETGNPIDKIVKGKREEEYTAMGNGDRGPDSIGGKLGDLTEERGANEMERQD
ncbi:hypothetical protein HK104_010187 [Borealophlyctis nickersoniae]|nr:hypothetical protein HK104_010187 [Borealophlyctis nickersoniae]